MIINHLNSLPQESADADDLAAGGSEGVLSAAPESAASISDMPEMGLGDLSRLLAMDPRIGGSLSARQAMPAGIDRLSLLGDGFILTMTQGARDYGSLGSDSGTDSVFDTLVLSETN